MPTDQPAIQLDRVARHYTLGESTIRAVDDVSLSVPTGEFLALLGSSGSGKSTLLNLIAGLDRPTSGAVIANGQDLSQVSSLELARYRRQTVGMVFQSFNLLPRMTLEENVELPLRLAEVPRQDRAARVQEALDRDPSRSASPTVSRSWATANWSPTEPRDEAPRPWRSRTAESSRSPSAQFAYDSGRRRGGGLKKMSESGDRAFISICSGDM